MPFTVATASASFRANTEDRLAVHHVPGGVVVVVADGAGGIPGGGRAADLAIQLVADALSQPSFKPFVPASLAALLVHADAIVETDSRNGQELWIEG